MKAVPILIITNALALGLAIMAYVELDDMKSQRGGARQSTARGGAGNEALDEERYQKLLGRIAELEADRGIAAPDAAGTVASNGGGSLEPGKPIDRGSPAAADFDEDAEMASPAFDNFRQRVRLAQEANEREDRLNQQIERLDEYIATNRIGALNEKQKHQAAETLLATRQKTRLIWRGLREREDLQNLPTEERRQAYRDAYRKEQETIRAEALKDLGQIMPAADAETLLSSGRGDFGGRRGRGR